MSEYRVVHCANFTAEIMSGVKVDAAVVARFCICRDCSLIFQNPRMSDRELDKYYGTGYYRRTINATDEEMDTDEAYRAKIDIEIIRRYAGKVSSHLDIGCGRGYLLKAVGADEMAGVETDETYVKAKGVKVYSKIGKIPAKKFDLVTAIHVLEHIANPLDYLKKMAKFVGKEGYLVIEVPTWKSPGGPLRLAHLYHFEPDVLKLMCKQAGLSVIHTEFTPHPIVICSLKEKLR